MQIHNHQRIIELISFPFLAITLIVSACIYSSFMLVDILNIPVNISNDSAH